MRSFRFLLATALAATGIAVITASPAIAVTAPVTNLDQCQQATPSTSCTWINGNNSGFAEDQVIPQRAVIAIPAGTSTATFDYDDLIGTTHEIDYLASWNFTQTTATPCDGTGVTCSAAPATYPIADDNASRGLDIGYNTIVHSHELPTADRQLMLYGAGSTTLTGAAISHPGLTTGRITVTFNAPSATTGVLLFGAHMALTGPNTEPHAWAQGASTKNGTIHVTVSSGGAKTNPIKVGPGNILPAPPAFTITKSAPATATAGSVVSYSITVGNTGGSAGTTTFTDTYDTAMTGVGVPNGCSDGPGADQFTCTTGSIAPGGSQVFTYTATVPATFAADAATCSSGGYAVANTAQLPDGTSSTATVCVSAAPAFTLTKTADASTASIGQTVTYDLTVHNGGSAPGDTTVTDNYDDRTLPSTPAGCTNDLVSHRLTCTVTGLAAGADKVFEYTAAMPLAFLGISGTGGCNLGFYPVANSANLPNVTPVTVTVCVGAAPHFTITKTASTTGQPGAGVTYTVTVTNDGTATGIASFTDTSDAGLGVSVPHGCVAATNGFTCSNIVLNPGTHQDFTSTATLPTTYGATPGGSGCTGSTYPVSNTATLAGATTGFTATVCVPATPAYTITKTASTTATQPGKPVTYTVTVKNTGAAAGSTTFTDDFDDRIDPGTVTSTPSGGTCSVVGTSNLVLSCTTGVIAGGNGTQTFSYTAAMPATFTGDPGSPNGTPCDTTSYPVPNTATLTGTNATPGSSTASTTVCVAAAPHLTISKSVSPTNTPAPGATVTYTITVSNDGTAAGSTTVTDTYDSRLHPVLPAGSPCTDSGTALTCPTGTVLAGSSTSFSYTAVIPQTFTGSPSSSCSNGGYLITNTATTSAGATSGVNVCVVAAASFLVTKSVSPADVGPGDTVAPGATVHYTIGVQNTGDAAGSTTAVDHYDPRLQVSDAGGCTNDTTQHTLSCDTGSLAAGASTSFTYAVAVPQTFTGSAGGGSCASTDYLLTNAVVVPGSQASQDICVTARPDLTIAKSVTPGVVSPGGTATYTITVTNNGSAPGSGDFTDSYDPRLTPGTATSNPAGNDCAPSVLVGIHAFSCTTGSIDPGQSQTFTYTATVPTTVSAADGPFNSGACSDHEPAITLQNTATLVDSDAPPATATLCDQFTFAKPVYAKTVLETNPSPGDTVHYTITVSNPASVPTVADSVVDSHPQVAVTAVTPSRATDTCTIDSSSQFTCQVGSLDPGAQVTFTYTAQLPSTFTGSPGGSGCGPTQYPVTNSIRPGVGTTVGTGTVVVCVGAAPEFSVIKTVDHPSAHPGDTVHYTLTVTNNGNAAGSTMLVDHYDSRLDPAAPTDCVKSIADDTLTCATGVLAAAGGTQSFGYDATLPTTYTGDSGVEPCTAGQYAVTNRVTLGSDTTTVASQTVCVTAGPAFTVTKSSDATTPTAPGQLITYTVTVTNTGAVAGSTTVTDDYDNSINPTVPSGCQAAGGVLTCTTGVLAPLTGSQTFTYTATMPVSFTGPSGTEGCPSGQYGVGNTATVPGSNPPASTTVCVTAAPSLSLGKSGSLAVADNGDQLITYTLTPGNTGPAAATGAVVSDPIPTGTTFASCTGGCTVAGSPAKATWPAQTIAPLTGSATYTLVVKVTSNVLCSVNNTASVKADGVSAVSSPTVTTPITPQPNTTTANASGTATGVSVQTNGVLNILSAVLGALTNNNTLVVSHAASSQTGPGGPATNGQQVLSARLPSNSPLVIAGVLTTTTTSSVTQAPAEARQTSTAEVANVCLVPVAGVCTVSLDALRAVASTLATGSYAANSTAGSTITNLKVVNLAIPVDLNQTTTIPLNAVVFGKGSYVAINEHSGSSGLSGSNYVADQSVALIHVKITGALGVQAAEIYVGKATAHSQFARTTVCGGSAHQSVSGHAYLTRLYTGPLLADLLQGYVEIAPLGGSSSQHIVQADLPASGGYVGAQVGDTFSAGSFTSTGSSADSWAEVAGNGTQPLCVLNYVTGCAITATAIRSEARSTATITGSASTDTGTTLANVKIFGIPIAASVKPNTVITLPGIGYVVLNEQVCDNGGAASSNCTGRPHSGITVRAIHVVVTLANTLLGLSPGIELVVAEAHADSSFG
jgi:uncharacterized repeat protein (TIGR01451 family)